MSITGDNIRAFNNQVNRNYAVNFFHNMNGNILIQMLIDWIESGGGSGPGTTPPAMITVTSANFTNATDCPIVAYAGMNLAVLWVDPPKPLIAGTDFSLLVGGGFKVLIPGFDSTTGTFTFWVFITA